MCFSAGRIKRSTAPAALLSRTVPIAGTARRLVRPAPEDPKEFVFRAESGRTAALHDASLRAARPSEWDTALAVRALDLPPGVLRPRSHPRLADAANHSDVLRQIERRLWHGTACSACGSKLDRMRSQRRDEFRKRELRPQSSRRFPSFCSTLPSDRRPLRPLGRTDSITGKVSQTGTAWLTGSNRTARTTDTTCRLPLLPVRLSQSDLPAETD